VTYKTACGCAVNYEWLRNMVVVYFGMMSWVVWNKYDEVKYIFGVISRVSCVDSMVVYVFGIIP